MIYTMKKFSCMIAAALLFVGCGSSDEIKLSDQTGFHQAVEHGRELGTKIYNAQSYDEFKSASDEAKEYAEAFRTQLGGESYLAYLKSVVSASNGIVLTEADVNTDEDINNLRTFYNPNKTNEDDVVSGSSHSAAADQAVEFSRRLKEIKEKKQNIVSDYMAGNEDNAKQMWEQNQKEYLALRDDILAKGQEYLDRGDLKGYSELMDAIDFK